LVAVACVLRGGIQSVERIVNAGHNNNALPLPGWLWPILSCQADDPQRLIEKVGIVPNPSCSRRDAGRLRRNAAITISLA
jgi:hypothetical protein